MGRQKPTVTACGTVGSSHMSLLKNREFSIEALMSEAQYFAERIYTFFRWAVEDDFLRRFGGKL
ncbi:MAG: hypothetical protein SAK29_17740, partial [Scytonema sp. PMC 1069.18]|nr:hypothetical protein [Scytonema sp. PMC 1069.18]MEC4884926.1 hypothetical protein [Scytonema sp. PMC 1070.18]